MFPYSVQLSKFGIKQENGFLLIGLQPELEANLTK